MSETEQLIRSFDYSSAIRDLKSRDIIASWHHENTNTQCSFFLALGLNSRLSSPRETQVLIEDLLRPSDQKQHSRTLQSVSQSPNVARITKYARGVESMTGAESMGENDPEEGLSIYTSTLFERGQGINEVPQRKYNCLGINPPRFKAIIHFQNSIGIGFGQNKKIAGHMAAKSLCDKLGFFVERDGDASFTHSS